MSLEDELLALAGDSEEEEDEEDEDEEDEAKSASSPPPAKQPTPAPGAPSSPKKRSRAPVRQSRKKQRRSGHNDDGDAIKNEDSETLSDEDSDAVSDNEREAPMDMGSESGSDEDDHNEPSLYPLEGKYKDHADKEHLQAMTEIDREAVLAERMAQIEREQQDRHLRNLLKSRNAADRAKGAAAAAASTRKSLRTKSAPKQTQEATKRGKLDELRRNREERKATGRRSSFGDEDASRRLLSDGEEDFTPEAPAKEERPIELADINLCRLGRTSLSKHLDYPDFENVAIDVFVRVTMFDKESNRNVYRMAQIKGFRTGKPYSMLDGARKTDQHLRVTHGKSERDFPMDMMSDSRFTESEFNRYKNQLEIDKVPLPTLSHVRNKSKALHTLTTRSLTTGELEVMLKKRNAGKHDYVINMTKRRSLMEQRAKAIQEEDEFEVSRLDRELQELEDQTAGPARAESQMQRMARINAENRKRNMAEVRRAEIAEKKAAREALLKAEAQGGSFANPFMRVKTAVKFRHDMGVTEKKEEVAVGTSPPKEALSPPTAGKGFVDGTPIKGRRGGGVDDVIASMDLGIEIDL